LKSGDYGSFFEGMLLFCYRLLFLPVLLAMSPYYLWRMRRRGGYRKHFAHRLGRHRRVSRTHPGARRVWLQAVSVGEMLAVAPMIEALHREGIEVYLTTTTSTGYRLADDRYREMTVGIGYFPIDWWRFSARAWRRIAPDLAILTEGERWPEHLHQARRRGVPVVCVNARLTERSFRRWNLYRPAARWVFRGIARMLPCSARDEARFAALGFPAERMQVTGNIKLDVTIPPLAAGERGQIRRELGLPEGGLVLLGSSTWPGEETALFEALRRVRGTGIRCALVIVPRHAERRLEIERLLRSAGLRSHFRSRGPAPGEVDVAVGDTTGELRRITQVADLVFVGKSLGPHTEGQTPIEAASLGKPVLFGPGMASFREIAAELEACGGARRIADAAGIATAAAELLRDEKRREAMSAAALGWHRANQGATERTLAVIREELAAIRRSRR
jgi:3-deoxy-D-manno-octulosonic-acid transferase